MTDRARIEQALAIAYSYGDVRGEPQQTWVLDQLVRALTGCPQVSRETALGVVVERGASDEYRAWVAEHGEWDEGEIP